MIRQALVLRIGVSALVALLPAQAMALEAVAVSLVGVQDTELRDSLQANSILKTLEGNADTSGADVLAAARSEYARMIEVLYAKGYYSSVVNVLVDGREAALIDPFREPSAVTKVQIQVQPGRPFRFGQARIGPLHENAPPDAAFRTGAPALADVVRSTASNAVKDWRSAGYAKAKVAGQSVLARHDSAQLDVEIALAPGPRVTFGETTVTGDTKVREKRVRKIASIPSGQVYDPDAVAKAASRLRKTGTFKSVQVVEGEKVNPDGSMDMQIKVVDRKPRRIGGGVELSSQDGVTLSGYWLHRNILGGAETLRIDSEVAQIGASSEGMDYSLSARFEKPAAFGGDTLLFAEGGLSYSDESDYLEKQVELTVGLSREYGERLTAELGVGYSFSRVTDLYTTPNTERDIQIFSLPFALTYDARDNRLDAKDGIYVKSELTPFYETVLGQSGAHLTFDARGYKSVGTGGKTVLAGRFQLGRLVGLSAEDAPPDYFFYSGGSGTVRGQAYQSLGATIASGTTGGRAFAGLSGEVRYAINETFGLVAFADAGFIGAEGFGSGAWHSGAGLGLRYQTPVGPIRLDVAAPVSGGSGSGVQLYVGIGQAF